MNDLAFRNQGPKISAIEISSFEKEYIFTLPKDYKRYLLENNGGDPNKVYYLENNADLVVNFFYSLGSQKFSLEQAIDDMKYDDPVVAKDFIPIGEDAFGNVLCLSVNEKTYGNVFSWDHEERGVRFISASFSNLLEGLKESI